MPKFNLWNWILKGGYDSFMLRSSRKTPQQKMQDMNELIAKKAYELYEKRGNAHGSDFQDWLEAERLVKRDMRSR